jgi:serine/threonine-protein kinase
MRDHDVLYGNIALNKGYVTQDLLQSAMVYKQAKAPDKPLGEILVAYGYMSADQHREVATYIARVTQARARSTSRRSPRIEPPPPPPPPDAQPGSDRWSAPSSTAPQGTWEPSPTTGAQRDFDGGGGNVAVAEGPTPNPDGDPLLGTTIAGCQLNAKLGAGAMASVYLAHHESLRKDVVIKILSPECSAKPRTVERFFREARAAARLEHPNIVMVHDVGTTDSGLNFMVMQYVDGVNLEEKLNEEGRQTPENATNIVLQVARGLGVAHADNVIHRDIKADNILFDQHGMVKLTDFGLAKDMNLDPLTQEGSFIGTPLYMAPEIGRLQVDGRVDIYSLGVTFYYLLTGVQPFREFSGMQILRAQAHEKIRPPETHHEIPEAHRRVLGKMLEKDREQRYPDIPELLKDLEALERNLPVDAGVPNLWGELGGGDPEPAPAAPASPVSAGASSSPETKRVSTSAVIAVASAVLLIASLVAIGALYLLGNQ